MKAIHWGGLVLLVGAFLGCKQEEPSAAAERPTVSPVKELVGAVAKAQDMQGKAVESEPKVEAVRPVDEIKEAEHQEPPPGISVKLSEQGSGEKLLHISEAGKLLALRQGKSKAVGYGKVSLTLKDDETAPIIWERSDPSRELETIRGIVRLSAGSLLVRMAEKPMVVSEEKKGRHYCQAIGDGAGGFIVLCKVQGIVTAANLNRNINSKEGVFVQAGEPTVVRLELPMSEGSAEALAIGYAYSGIGMVFRAEGSWMAGERSAHLALQSAERRQANGFRMFKHFPRPHPHPLDFDI